ncbi:hypothetical protein [Natrinema soli]|uniref:HEAT repeat domain-containing protein n=1 Tax=Natrinema soli TaxID=1930624 RepID=A0ABD5SXA8_9EURY|nr:hypothetical protein [Natrinema soli]
MSSRTPEDCVELALDEEAAEADRTDAIHELKLANECDELEALVREASVDDWYRRHALEALTTPQCDSTLRELVDDEPLEGPLHQEAEELLATVEDD